MSRDYTGPAEFNFLQALMSRGFVNIPRMLFDYPVELELDYDTVGKLVIVMAQVSQASDNPFRPYTISRRSLPAHEFELIRKLAFDLEAKVIVRVEEEAEQLTISLIPLFTQLRALWERRRELYEEEAATNKHPAVAAAEQQLGRPLSDSEAKEIMDWVDAYHFDPPMVQAVIKEGQNSGVTRMSYLSQVALHWSEAGIRTPEEAEQFRLQSRKAAGKHKSIVQYLGLKFSLTKAEETLLDKWTDEWGFSNEVIIRACAESVGIKNPLQYVNKILESWRDRGVRTVADAEQLMTEHKRTAGATAPGRNGSDRRSPKRSNVFLRRDEKEEDDDYIFKKFED